MSVLLEWVIIIVFSLYLGEPLVIDLAMVSFISLPYIVLHHNFLFLYLIAFWWVHIRLVILWFFDTMIGCSDSSFLESSCFSFTFGSMEFLVDSMPWRFQLLPFIIGSWMWMDKQGYFKGSFQKRLLIKSHCFSLLLSGIDNSSYLINHII